MAEALLDAVDGLPTAECDRLFDETILLGLKLREALAIPLKHPQDALKFLALPFGIVTAAGCVAGEAPVLEIHRDCTAERALRSADQPTAFGTFALADAVLLRSLGLAAAPVARLERLGLAGLKKLVELTREPPWQGTLAAPDVPEEDGDEFEKSEGAPQEGDTPASSLQLILVAGSLTALTAEAPAGLYPLARHLTGAEKSLELSWQNVRVWPPTRLDLAAIRKTRRPPGKPRGSVGGQAPDRRPGENLDNFSAPEN